MPWSGHSVLLSPQTAVALQGNKAENALNYLNLRGR
jgi:hypothetical protein